ncbi:hypothetical protein GBAR_LOCUS7119 [Geodia barretti]|uniref:Uncharacterized protein n=1 Tax=Geodia barretti TaxID=519541 RepID=A0AA35RIU4_GEOBA|nr:hypothetical protein GBAR_LOCUS7119 [Geodia barretti]
MLCFCRGRRDFEDNFPHHNWLISIFVLLTVGYVGHIMFTPSIYQFVTTDRSPSSDDNEENSDHFWPGLGGTDRDYAWTLISFSLFEAGTLPLATAMMDVVPYTVLILIMLFLYGVSGAVYATATDVWMVILARCLMGCASLLLSSIVYTYIGEMGTTMDRARNKKGKLPRKNLLYLLAILGATFANALLLGIYAAISRIPSVNPYRWPGWFLAALALSSAVVVVLFFTEPRPWTCHWNNKSKCVPCGLGLSVKLRSKKKRQLTVRIFIMACGYVGGEVQAVIFTLVTPVLSHQFGFDVANTSLFLLAVPVAYLGVAILVVIAERVLKRNNRLMVGLSLIISLVGCVLIGDWQTIDGDPCSFQTMNDTASLGSATGLDDINANLTGFQLSVADCEAQSTSSHQCFWNPQSRVTGDYCSTCLPACLSQQTSLNFYQFSAGVFLTALGSLLGYIFVNALNSDVTPVKHQAILILCREERLHFWWHVVL